MADSEGRMLAALGRLAKWRSWFAGWQLGTQPDSHGPTRAVRDATEARLILRAEVTALGGLLLEKGICTQAEFQEALAREADVLSEELSRRFPGVEATDVGLRFDVAKMAATMRREGFPP